MSLFTNIWLTALFFSFNQRQRWRRIIELANKSALVGLAEVREWTATIGITLVENAKSPWNVSVKPETNFNCIRRDVPSDDGNADEWRVEWSPPSNTHGMRWSPRLADTNALARTADGRPSFDGDGVRLMWLLRIGWRLTIICWTFVLPARYIIRYMTTGLAEMRLLPLGRVGGHNWLRGAGSGCRYGSGSETRLLRVMYGERFVLSLLEEWIWEMASSSVDSLRHGCLYGGYCETPIPSFSIYIVVVV